MRQALLVSYPESDKLAAIVAEVNLDVGDPCHGWACAAPGDQVIDRGICTLSDDLNLPGDMKDLLAKVMESNAECISTYVAINSGR